MRAFHKSLTLETDLWMRRWLFLATAGLFGYADGSEWGVSHYRMKAAQ
jgi:cyclopropane-fatty-acyl-phospholipid synthase